MAQRFPWTCPMIDEVLDYLEKLEYTFSDLKSAEVKDLHVHIENMDDVLNLLDAKKKVMEEIRSTNADLREYGEEKEKEAATNLENYEYEEKLRHQYESELDDARKEINALQDQLDAVT